MNKILIAILVVFFTCNALNGSSVNIQISDGWNLISVPFECSHTDDFDGVILPAYGWFNSTRNYYDVSILSADTLYSGIGYWILSPNDQTIRISGTIDTCLTYSSLLPGWNMLGSPYSPISASDYIAHYSDTADIIRPLYYYNTEARAYDSLGTLTSGTGFWLLSGDTVSLDSCVNSANLPGSSLWTVEIDSAAQYYRNISSPSLDEEGCVYFSEHRDYDTTDTVSDDTEEYFSEYKFNSSGSMLWSVNISENAHFKHNPTPVIDIDRRVSYCATGPYCFTHFIDSGDLCDSIVYIGQGHYVGDPAIDCEHFHLSRFNAHGRGAPINTSSRIEMYNFSSYTVIDTFSTNALTGDLDFRIVTGPIIDHNGRIIFGANKIDGGDDSLHLDPCMVISVDVDSDAFVFVDSINAGTFAKYSSFALDTNSSGNTRIFAGSMDGLVYAFLDEGDTLHKLFEIVLGGTINSNPVINNDGIMYVGSADANTLQNGRLWALDIDSLITLGGTLDTSYAIWHYPHSGFLEGGIYGSPTIGDDGVIYFGETEGEGYLYAISDHGDSAHFEWRYRRDSLDNIRCCPIVSKDGIVYYTSKTYDEPKFYLNCEVISA